MKRNFLSEVSDVLIGMGASDICVLWDKNKNVVIVSEKARLISFKLRKLFCANLTKSLSFPKNVKVSQFITRMELGELVF